MWQYHWTIRYLWSGSFAPIAGMTKEGIQTPLYAVTFALILIGMFAFGAVCCVSCSAQIEGLQLAESL